MSTLNVEVRLDKFDDWSWIAVDDTNFSDFEF